MPQDDEGTNGQTESDEHCWFDETLRQMKVPLPLSEAVSLGIRTCERWQYKTIDDRIADTEVIITGTSRRRWIDLWAEGTPELVKMRLRALDQNLTQFDVTWGISEFFRQTLFVIIGFGLFCLPIGIFLYAITANVGFLNLCGKALGVLLMVFGMGMIVLPGLGQLSNSEERFLQTLGNLCGQKMTDPPIVVVPDKLPGSAVLTFCLLGAFLVVFGTYLSFLFFPQPLALIPTFGLLILVCPASSLAILQYWNDLLIPRLSLCVQGMLIGGSMLGYFVTYLLSTCLTYRALNHPGSHLDATIISLVTTANFGCCFLFAAQGVKTSNYIENLLNRSTSPYDKHDFLVAMKESIQVPVFRLWVISLWLIITVGNTAGLLLCGWLVFEAIGLAPTYNITLISGLLKRDTHLALPQCILATRLLIALYVIPVVVAAISLLKSAWARYNRPAILLKIASETPSSIKEVISRIASFGGIPAPEVCVIDSPGIYAYITTDRKICITRYSLSPAVLTEFEIEALLAHELGHFVKLHVRSSALLWRLSEWTLFGYGFLAVIQNSFETEFEADDFAVQWCRNRNIPEQCVEAMLDKVEASWSVHYGSRDSTRPNAIGSLCVAGDRRQRKQARKADSYAGWKLKIGPLRIDSGVAQLNEEIVSWKSRWRLFQRQFRGDEVLGYFHPTYDERRRRIRGGKNDLN